LTVQNRVGGIPAAWGRRFYSRSFPAPAIVKASNKVYTNYKVCNNRTCKKQYIHTTGTHETAVCVVLFTRSFGLTVKWLLELFQCSAHLITIFKMSACCACVLRIP